MALVTGRAKEVAQVAIDHEKCNLCGLCTQICSGDPLTIIDNKVIVDQSRGFGCIGCGQCVLVCPNECITVNGRELSMNHVQPLPPRESRSSYELLYNLLLSRRSIRRFRDKPVDQDMIDKIIEAATTAPMGLPPSDVEILVFNGKEKVQGFAEDLVKAFYSSRWLFGRVMRTIMRPLWGKEFVDSAKYFLEPLINGFKSERENGTDILFYEAPLVMYFHASVYADPVDPLVNATYAMIAAESLGLGSCMIGTPAPFLKYNKKLKQKYRIGLKNHQGIAIIFGFPSVKYQRTIKRTLASVHYWGSATIMPL